MKRRLCVVHRCVSDCAHICAAHIFPQERRREFEANLEKIGLHLETEDKTVSYFKTNRLHHLVAYMRRHNKYLQKDELSPLYYCKGNVQQGESL